MDPYTCMIAVPASIAASLAMNNKAEFSILPIWRRYVEGEFGRVLVTKGTDGKGLQSSYQQLGFYMTYYFGE